MDFIERIKEKPQSQKAHYAFMAAFAVTLVVTAAWSTTIPTRFAAIDARKDEAPEVTNSREDSLGAIFNSVKEQFANVVSATPELEPVAAEPSGMEPTTVILSDSESAEQPVVLPQNSESDATVPVRIASSTTDTPAPQTESSETNSTSEQPNSDTILTPTPAAPVEPRVILIATTSAQQTE